jgi:glyoxylase-like metal-dependent hydrolase (beta-lactamase superfamily II)
VITDEGCLVMDTQATPAQAQKVIARIRAITAAPIKFVVLSHYHAVRVLGASAYDAQAIVASRGTFELIAERGQQDFESEVGRFPRLFERVETVPGLTWPTIVFERELTIRLGGKEIRLIHLGRGHTKGDTIAWLPKERVCFSGDLVEYGATPYAGDAYLEDWPQTLDRLAALAPSKLIPGRGPALKTVNDVIEGIRQTRAFVNELYRSVSAGRAIGKTLKAIYDETVAQLRPAYGHWVIFEHCMPFDVARAYDEAGGTRDPRIWTAERDRAMWEALERGEPDRSDAR